MKYVWKRWVTVLNERNNRKTLEKLNIEKNTTIYNEVNSAYEMWCAAKNIFNEMTEKDQIDYAIFALEAAEKRYECLIRQAKKHFLELAKKD